MKATVIICTYDRFDSLLTALQCLEWQTYPDFEVIVVESTDNTKTVLKTYEGKIKNLFNAKAHYNISQNIALRKSSGDIICFLNDDSEPDTVWLENVMHEFLDENVGVVTGPTLSSQGDSTEFVAWLYKDDTSVEIKERYPFYNTKESEVFPFAHGCNMAVRRSVLEKVGGILEELLFYHDDTELCRRIVFSGFNLVNVDSCAMIHRNLPSTADIREEEKGLLAPYNYLKNKIYLHILWNSWQSEQEHISWAKASAKEMYQDGYQRLMNGKISKEELSVFEKEIEPALKWGLECGTANLFSPPRIEFSPADDFLPFPRKRKKDALLICFLAWSFEGETGGAPDTYLTLAQELVLRGHEVHLFYPQREQVSGKFFLNSIHLHRQKAFPKETLVAPWHGGEGNLLDAITIYRGIKDFQKYHKIDIVMSFIVSSTATLCALDPTLHTVLSLCTTHKTWCKAHPHWENEGSKFIAGLEAFSLAHHLHIHTLSNFITEGVQKDYPLAMPEKANIFYVPLGVNPPDQNLFPSRNDNKVRVTFISRLEGRKGPDVLLHAMAKILSHNANLELYMCGNNRHASPTGKTYQEEFENEYAGTEIIKNVHFLGYISNEEKWQQYSQCDIFCVPSLSESFGIIFIEAMSFGKPVIGCRAGGMPEVITEGETGLLAEPGDVDSLVQCLETLINDAELRKRMGKVARKRYEENFTAKLYAERMEKEFYRICGKTEASL